ncbi:MAG: hypothetical protein WEE50_05355 [Chloroflexota bacterium]
MFDPAAMGTLIIGLNANKADTELDRPRRQPPTPRRARRGIRVALANALRQAAAVLEPPAVRDTAS